MSKQKIDSGVYRIVSTSRPDRDLVVSLEKGIPKGNLVVEKRKDSAPYQLWFVADQSDGIYTFKSLIDEYGGKKIKDAAQPYARNTDQEITPNTKIEDITDPYIRGGQIDLFTTFRIRPGTLPETFTIGLPERDPTTVWTIVDDSINIILAEETHHKEQLWRFEVHEIKK